MVHLGRSLAGLGSVRGAKGERYSARGRGRVLRRVVAWRRREGQRGKGRVDHHHNDIASSTTGRHHHHQVTDIISLYLHSISLFVRSFKVSRPSSVHRFRAVQLSLLGLYLRFGRFARARQSSRFEIETGRFCVMGREIISLSGEEESLFIT